MNEGRESQHGEDRGGGSMGGGQKDQEKPVNTRRKPPKDREEVTGIK